MRLFEKIFAAAALTGLLAAAPQANSAKTADAAKTTAAKASPKASPVSAAEIDSARSKGLVWVNTNSKIYHKDGEFYGKTKHGKFMTEGDAKKEGYRAAKEGAVGGKKKDAAQAAAAKADKKAVATK